MSESLRKLHQQAQSLSDAERAELAYLLLNSLDPNGDSAGTDEDLNLTVARRSAEISSGHAAGHAAKDVHGEIRKRYS